MFRSDLIATLKQAESGQLLAVDIDHHLGPTGSVALRKKATQQPTSKSKATVGATAPLKSKPVVSSTLPSAPLVPQNKATNKVADKSSSNGDFMRLLATLRPIGSSTSYDNSDNQKEKRIAVKRSSVVPIVDAAPLKALQKVKDQEKLQADEIVNKSILGATELLPVDMLVKYRMHDALKTRACRALAAVLQDMAASLLYRALHKWHRTSQIILDVYARRITRLMRSVYYMARAKRNASFLRSEAANVAAMRQQRRRYEERCATRIQSWIRQYLAKVIYLRLYHRWASFLRISRVVSVVVSAQRWRRVALQRARRKTLLRTTATRIQAAARGYIIRRKLASVPVPKKVMKLRAYDDEEEIKNRYFARHGAALKIQKAFIAHRKHLGHRRKKLHIKESAVEEVAPVARQIPQRLVIAVQCAARVFIARQRLFRLRHQFQGKQVRTIQLAWRRALARMHLHSLIHKKLQLSRALSKAWRVITRWIVPILAARRTRHQLHRDRCRLEAKEAGAIMFSLSIHRWEVNLLWRSARQIQNVHGPYELQKFFAAASQSGMLDMSKALKIMKECNGCVDKKLNPKFIDMVFTKVKARTEKKLDYPRFLDFLFVLACKKLLSIDASNKNPDDLLAPPKVSDVYDESIPFKVSDHERGLILSFTYWQLRGKSALIIAFVEKYLSTHADYIRLSKVLSTRSDLSLALAHINKAAKQVGSYLSRQIKSRNWQRLNTLRKQLTVQKYRDMQCTKLQAFYRGCRGRQTSVTAAQAVYFKYIDASTSTHYWYNSRTGVSFWTKPNFLRTLDCGFPVLLPADDSLFIIYCSVCETKTLQCLCDECNEIMCDSCFHKTHRTGQRKLHERIGIPSCARCEFQVGTRLCEFCKDAYCDTCYDFEHRKASFRSHRFKWLTDCCCKCTKRAAQLTACVESNDYTDQFVCVVCCKEYFGDPDTTEGITRRKFVGHLVSKRRGEKRLAADVHDRADIYKQQRAVMLEQDRLEAAIKVQRVFRGFISRKKIKPFLEERREHVRIKAEVDKAKSAAQYMVLDAIGLAPVLKTDTTRERFLKMYPRHERRVVEECIDHEWDAVATFVAEIEKHLAEFGGRNQWKAFVYSLKIQLDRYELSKIESQLERTAVKLDELRLKLRGCTDREEKQAVKKEVELNTTLVETLGQKCTLLTAELEQLEADYINFGGPHYFFDLIRERRCIGIEMQCTLAMSRGMKTALATTVNNSDTKHSKLYFKIGDKVNIKGYIFSVERVANPVDNEDGSKCYEVEFERYWNAEDAEIVPRRIVRKIIIMRELYYGIRFAHASFPAQYVINLSARICDGISKRLDQVSGMFEEDSKMALQFMDKASKVRCTRDFICKYSFEPVDMNPPYSLRNLTKTGYATALKLRTTLNKLMKLLRPKPLTPYQMWERKDGQVVIKCILLVGKHPKQKQEELGEFNMSMQTPCDVCREFIERAFRHKLNQSVGSSFCFVYNEESGQKVLPREKESRTYAKKVIPFVINPSTLIGTHIATITADIVIDPQFIPPFPLEPGEQADDDDGDQSVERKEPAERKGEALDAADQLIENNKARTVEVLYAV